MGFFLTAAAFIAILALASWAIDEPIRRTLQAYDAAHDRPAARRSIGSRTSVPVPIPPESTCAITGRVVRLSVRPPEDPSALVAAIDDGNAVVGVRLPSSVAGFIHTGELLSVTGTMVQANGDTRIYPREAALVGEAGWSIQLPLQVDGTHR
jgi:hypothetical protein